MAEKDNKKKQVPLRLSAKLYDAIAAWAEDDFRSVNGQIEYLLTECVRQRKKNGKYVSSHLHFNATYLLEADSEEAVSIKVDENSGVAWFSPEDALKKSTEPWFVEHVYAKLIEKATHAN